MDEIVARQILLDFEIVMLITLFLGVISYLFLRRGRGYRFPVLEQGSNDFDLFDFALMFFPALLFLINPFVEVAFDTTEMERPTAEDTVGIGTMIVNLVFIGFVGVMTVGINSWVRNRSVTQLFGLRRRPLSHIVLWTIFGGIASLFICAWGLGTASEAFLSGIFDDLGQQDPVKMLQESDSLSYIIFSSVMACIAAPLVEEFLFRGYMYGVVKRFASPVFSAIVIGGLFAVVHGNLPALIPLWGFSILLTISYEVTKCLWVPIGIHAFFNAANIVLMLLPEPVE